MSGRKDLVLLGDEHGVDELVYRAHLVCLTGEVAEPAVVGAPHQGGDPDPVGVGHHHCRCQAPLRVTLIQVARQRQDMQDGREVRTSPQDKLVGTVGLQPDVRLVAERLIERRVDVHLTRKLERQAAGGRVLVKGEGLTLLCNQEIHRLCPDLQSAAEATDLDRFQQRPLVNPRRRLG